MALATLSTFVSGYFLLRNLYPILVTAPNVSARLLLPVVGALHFALGLGLWFGFLQGGAGVLHPGADDGAGAPSLPDMSGAPGADPTGAGGRWLW